MDFPARLKDDYVKSGYPMSILVRPLRPFALALSMLLLDACGGGSGAGSTSAPSSSEDAVDAGNAGLQYRLDLTVNRVILDWSDSFATATRYQIEQRDASGAWVVIDGVWALHDPQGTRLKWTGPITGTATLRVEASLPDHTVPLLVLGPTPSTSLTVSLPAQIPSLVFDQPEPLGNSVNVALANTESILPADGGNHSVEYWIDGAVLSGSSVAPDYSATLHLDGVTAGKHLVSATVDRAGDFVSTLMISRNVEIHTTEGAVSVNTALTPDAYHVYALATSDSGIVSVVATLDLPVRASYTLTMPNACVPQPCGAGQPFNAYHFSFETKYLSSDFHTVAVEATDGAGNVSTGSAYFHLPAPPSVTLASPTDGASVLQSMHVAGTVASAVPGALEVMVTLSGVPVYDTTVANTGAEIPYAADVSLEGVSPGSHTLGVYARVGNTVYTQAATAVVQVAPSH